MRVLSGVYCIHMHSVPAYDSDGISTFACRSRRENYRLRHYRVPLALDLRPPVVSVDDRGQRSVTLSHNEGYLLCGVDCFRERI